MAYLPDDNEKSTKKDIIMPILYVLLGLIGAFNICILSYIGCEFVPWMMAGGFDAVAEQPVVQPTPAQQTSTPSTNIHTPPPVATGLPVDEGAIHTDQTQNEPPAEQPIEETTAQEPTQSTSTESAGHPAATKKPESSNAQTGGNSSGAAILPITPTIQPAPQTPSQGTAQQVPSGGGNQETYPKDPSKGKYIGSILETKYHYPSCRHAKRILPENEIWFDTIEEAKADGVGRDACGTCNPI